MFFKFKSNFGYQVKLLEKTPYGIFRCQLYVIIEDESQSDDILDIMESYLGSSPAWIVINGKKYIPRTKETREIIKVRLCKGLYFELYGLVDEKNVKIVKKSL